MMDKIKPFHAQIPHYKVLKLAPEPPMFGDRNGKTRWTIFVKGARK